MHHKLMKQTQSKLQVVCNKPCLHMTSTGEADTHHLLDAVLEKVFRVASHLGTAGSACPHVLPSMKTWRHQLNTLLPCCHSQLHWQLPHGLLYLGWIERKEKFTLFSNHNGSLLRRQPRALGGYPASCMLMMVGLLDMHTVSSCLASCNRCNAVGYILHMIRLHC